MATRWIHAQPDVVERFQGAFSPQMVGRNCALEEYRKIEVRSVAVTGECIAFASPDSTYAVTKRLFDQAQRSILVGIYDFTAGYIKELLLKSMRKGVKASLMLDLDGRTGETALFRDLVRRGCEGVPAPSCASTRARYFASSHEKVAVLDDSWTIVQSGNYSENSIPQNEKDGGDPNDFVPGNRDMGIAIHSKPLAAFFTKVLRGDMKLEREGAAGEALSAMAALEPVEMTQAAPSELPPQLFPSRRFHPSRAVQVLPVLSPDNYMEVIPDLLASASRSICIEQQYIRGNQELIGKLLVKIREAMDRRPQLNVRIIVAKPFPGRSFDREAQAIRDLGKNFGLKLGHNVRILNPRFFVHCHNKLIIVDDRTVLVSSQNWSDFAVSKNREAGVLLSYPEVARYFSSIFNLDWRTAASSLPKKLAAEFFDPQALSTGRVVALNWGDYAEV